MARAQTLVQLSDTLLALLDQRAARGGVSRSQLIREILEAHLRADHEARIGELIVEGYRRIPDEGDFDAWAEAGAREMIEEEPW